MKKILLIVIAFFMVTSCGSYRETVQVDDKAYLLLIGEPDGNIVTIDNSKPIVLGQDTTSFHLNGETATKIEVSIGTHTVKVTKEGVLTINRKFYVSTGNSFKLKL